MSNLENNNIEYKSIRLVKTYSGQSETDTNSGISLQEWKSPGADKFTPNKYEISVFDAASYILSKTGEITTMKLHKLLYYCQAWSLVWDDKPLFHEDIEAWANGPVIRSLFAFHRGSFSIETMPLGNADLLSRGQKETINSVLKYYGDKSTQWLIELTHLEAPWLSARKGLSPLERSSTVISHESMAEYYSSLSSQ